MNKKRLEEIEAKYSILTVFSERDGIEYIEVDVKDLVFLIQNGFKQAERVEELEEINIDVIIEIDMIQRINERLGKRVQELEEENRRYREALEFYANRENYKPSPNYYDHDIDEYISTIDYDNGATARKALEGEE